MFDPTAFDNLKVIFEGAVYDLDLTGDIQILDRKDLFDFAHYERCYQIRYSLPYHKSLSIEFHLKADMGHFLAERKMMTEKNTAGADIVIVYKGDEKLHLSRQFLEEAWGNDKYWEWKEVNSSMKPTSYEGILTFNRVITEEMVDDVLQMISFTVETLRELERKDF
ncbi:hypothetical protein CN378_02045 [Bacillus sp. AFS015802]|uniref:hypothetical protein n=1 Tax=Bacillus sp. AFS015802 TaxID=2033486 RepID=UPI000BF9CC7F|nr:hypothetical protein [Bacillus sp. AFS015802]PFA70109.1 hypothetical protein CN378_02045 [Bacillus sp. AFS015802]